MNHNYLSAASAAVALLIGCAVEGGGLTVGQAFIALVPIVVLLVWSFVQSDVCDIRSKIKCPTVREHR